MNLNSAQSGEEKTSFSLQAIAQAKLGEGKQDFDARRTYQARHAGGEELERLAQPPRAGHPPPRSRSSRPRRGTRTSHLDGPQAAPGVPRHLRVVSERAGSTGSRSTSPGGRGRGFPTKSERAETEQKQGAFVKPTLQGIGRDVHVLDFASTYPSIITTRNLGVDTKRVVPINGAGPRGALARAA